MHFNEDVKVLVGKNERSFTLRKDALCNHSRSFCAALERGFREAHERIARLPSIGIESFRAYTQSISRGEVVSMNSDDVLRDFDARQQRLLLIALYITGDQLADIFLRNTATDHLLKLSAATRRGFNRQSIRMVYDNLPRTFKVHEVELDEFCRWANDAGLSAHRNDLPVEFLGDFAILLPKCVQQSERPNPETAARFTYHVHDADTPMCQAFS